jgi:flagellin-like protein
MSKSELNVERRSWHTMRFLRLRRRRYALRGVLYLLSLGTAWETHAHDVGLYGDHRGASDPVALAVLIAMVVISTFATSEVK